MSLISIIIVSRFFTADGEFLATWGSQGSEKGQFEFVNDVAVDAQGYIYVVDSGNHRIQKFSPLSLVQ